jgi:acetyl esterase/lipase
VLLNAGSIHHVGPHRLYVRLSRELARQGHPALRLDFEGIGDSVLRGPGRENHPYSPTAMQDLEAALAFLRGDHGCTRFVVMGLCSGAYNAFQAGLQLEDPGVERLVMVNPWYFQWHEGLSLDTTIESHYEDVEAYRRAARDPERWKRLLRGEADLGRLARVAAAHVSKVARGRWDDLREVLVPSSGTRLSQDIRRIAARGRRMHVILSDGEPAAAILETQAARAVRRAKRAGLFTLDRVPGGDHTFSRYAPREALVRLIVEKLKT